ncbi:MAG: PIN domain-containing protein [Spirochaetaceae bacterium]|jgi:predicted nucleic acid-binding protein|nr:PIN domain-containing protein [Spirochaetaceae bacterium]
MEKVFIDTNIIVYANDRRDREKQEKALQLISKLLVTDRGTISTQVLQEYASVALSKLHQEHEIILRQIKLLESFEVIRQSPDMIRRALEIKHSYKIGFWDSCIISNAEFANCSIIYSEDLNGGQYYSGIKIVDPFAIDFE